MTGSVPADKRVPRVCGVSLYLPVRTVDFVDNLRDDDLFLNGVFEFLVLGVLVDLQVSALEWLANTKKKGKTKSLRSDPVSDGGTAGHRQQSADSKECLPAP